MRPFMLRPSEVFMQMADFLNIDQTRSKIAKSWP